MKIIDKNKDYYDFYQNIYRDDTFTFDRRDSYDLSKEEFASNFDDIYHYSARKPTKYYDCKMPENTIMLQVCHTFWLFQLIEKLENFKCVDYDLKLLKTWKNYNSEPKIIELSIVHVGCYFIRTINKEKESAFDPNTNTWYRYSKVFNNFKIYKNGNYEVKTIPILKNIGIASFVDPLDIYLSLEEYFSEMKTNSERTEPIGMTNDDKIISHGFDTKSSFRKM